MNLGQVQLARIKRITDTHAFVNWTENGNLMGKEVKKERLILVQINWTQKILYLKNIISLKSTMVLFFLSCLILGILTNYTKVVL